MSNVLENDSLADPIDVLIPPRRSRWSRLVAGPLIVVLVGTCAFLWGHGYVYPQPDCCGDGNGGALMTLSADGRAVTVTAVFFNSSGHDVLVRSAVADLPGATVLDVGMTTEDYFPQARLGSLLRLPQVVRGSQLRRLFITFIPVTCIDSGLPWGTATAHLEVAHNWLPTLDRSYRLPNAVVEDVNQLSVAWPDAASNTGEFHTPLAAACALLHREH